MKQFWSYTSTSFVCVTCVINKFHSQAVKSHCVPCPKLMHCNTESTQILCTNHSSSERLHMQSLKVTSNPVASHRLGTRKVARSRCADVGGQSLVFLSLAGCTGLAPRPMTVVFGLGTRLHVRMRITLPL